MRLLSFALRGATNLHAARIPPDPIARNSQGAPRRFGDELEDVFHRACATNSLDAAADVIAVLEKWAERRPAKYWRDRRGMDINLRAMRAELDRLTALRMV